MSFYGQPEGLGLTGPGAITDARNNLAFSNSVFPPVSGNFQRTPIAPTVNGDSSANTSTLAVFSFAAPPVLSFSSGSGLDTDWVDVGSSKYINWRGRFPGQETSGKFWYFDLRPGQVVKIRASMFLRTTRSINPTTNLNVANVRIRDYNGLTVAQPGYLGFSFPFQTSESPLTRASMLEMTRIVRLPVSTQKRTLSQLQAQGCALELQLTFSQSNADWTNQIRDFNYDVEILSLPSYNQELPTIEECLF